MVVIEHISVATAATGKCLAASYEIVLMDDVLSDQFGDEISVELYSSIKKK